jgi:hypothetical protein
MAFSPLKKTFKKVQKRFGKDNKRVLYLHPLSGG